jgi:hypothetical protein
MRDSLIVRRIGKFFFALKRCKRKSRPGPLTSRQRAGKLRGSETAYACVSFLTQPRNRYFIWYDAPHLFRKEIFQWAFKSS